MALHDGIALFDGTLRRNPDLRHPEGRDVSEKLLLQVLRDAIRLGNRHSSVHPNADIGVQTVSEPASLGFENLSYARYMLSGVADLVNDRRVDAVEHTRKDDLRRLPDNTEDRNGDQKSDNRVGQGETEPDAHGPRDDREARQSV